MTWFSAGESLYRGLPPNAETTPATPPGTSHRLWSKAFDVNNTVNQGGVLRRGQYITPNE